MKILEFLKKLRPYTLLISIMSGFIVFCIFHYIKEAVVLKPIAYFISDSLSTVLFLILFFAFCKIEFKQMSPQRWHFFCVAFQVLSTTLIAFILSTNEDATTAIFLEGLMICFITPTAASASVITGKLGGNESSLTTYIILSNLAASIVIPLILPFINNTQIDNFFNDFLLILSKVSPLLVMPLVLAIVIKVFFKKLHHFIVQHTKDIGFYMWALIIAVMSAKTFANIAASQNSVYEIILMALLGFIATLFQFALGKIIGQFDGKRISAGQGLGQKNMLFGIWVTLTYLSPTVAIIPGTYILWQNLMNAWQMWYRERLLKRSETQGVQPYQE